MFLLVCLSQAVAQWTLPPGTRLKVRLQTPVGTYKSKAGMTVRGVLIAPVMADGHILLPAGANVSGRVRRVRRVGLGLVHERAALDLEFDTLALPDGRVLPVDTHLVQVDNAREQVMKNGWINGGRETASPVYRVSRYLTMVLLNETHARLAQYAVKSLIAEIPEPEIYFPRGTDLAIELAEPLPVEAAFDAQPVETLSDADLDELERSLDGLPQRAWDPGRHGPSDLVNLVFVGSRAEVAAAFTAAGWSGADPDTAGSRWKSIRAFLEDGGYRRAPMSMLTWREAEPDMAWQKGLDTVAKRHHVRLWRAPVLWRGRELWVGAATRDARLAFLKTARGVTHAVDEAIDEERGKIVDDLAFAGCIAADGRIERPALARAAADPANGGITDGRLAAVWLRDCKGQAEEPDETPAPHGSLAQRALRREVLLMRNDLLRDNLYWRSFEALRYGTLMLHKRWQRRKTVAVEAKTTVAPAPAPTVRPEGRGGSSLATFMERGWAAGPW